MPTTLIVDRHPLFAEALAARMAKLDAKSETVIRDNLAEGLALARKDRKLELVLVDLDSAGRDALAQIRELAGLKQALRVIVLAAADDAGVIRQAMASGAHAFIPKSSSGELIVNAIRLVMAGGTYLPPHVLEAEPRRSGRPRRLAEPGAATAMESGRLQDLTERQRQVLELLAEGWSNQDIAGGLNIALATVKLHVNAILRALNVKNRTQAAGIAMRAALKGAGARSP